MVFFRRKRIHVVKGRRRLILKLTVAAVLIFTSVYFIKEKKEDLVAEGSNFLQALINRETNLELKIGKVSGKILGLIRFDQVRLENPVLVPEQRTIFKAQSVEFRYNLLDFLSKKFHSKIIITVDKPEIYWRPKIGLKRDAFPFFNWMRDLLLTQRQKFVLHAKDLKLVYGVNRDQLNGVYIDYENDQFSVTLPISHYDFMGNDVSTQLNLTARLDLGLAKDRDRLDGQIHTEGTVINWTPLPWEAKMDFSLSRTRLDIESLYLLGGLEVAGFAEFVPDPVVSLSLKTKDFPIKNFEPFISRGSIGSFDGFFNLDASFEGPAEALRAQIHATLVGGKSGKRHYKALNLHASGVYPTLNIYDSQMMMEDGISMKFADTTIEFWDLFSSRTYKRLIADSDQSEVAVGDWEFRRQMNESQLPEFLVGRALSKNASLQFRKFNEPLDETRLGANTEEKQQVEVGLEYRLKSKDSVHYKVREDEQIVGIERKFNF